MTIPLCIALPLLVLALHYDNWPRAWRWGWVKGKRWWRRSSPEWRTPILGEEVDTLCRATSCGWDNVIETDEIEFAIGDKRYVAKGAMRRLSTDSYMGGPIAYDITFVASGELREVTNATP